MTELVDFLNRCLDEDEHEAKDVGPRHADDDSGPYVHDDDAYYPLQVGAQFVLADIAAKRAIMQDHKLVEYPGIDGPCCARCESYMRFPCRTLVLLASAYRHRDGYREEWSP